MIKKIKKVIGEYVLKQRLKHHDRNRAVINFEQCHSVLILGSEPDDMGAMFASDLISYLKEMNKEVFTIFHPIGKKEEHSDFPKSMKIVEKIDLNMVFIPKDIFINELINREFDLLIDLSLNNQFTLKYIHSMSKAKFKVGASVNYKKKYSDLTIDIKNNPTVEYLITQIKHYVTNINKNVA